jgi:hypothetical protein
MNDTTLSPSITSCEGPTRNDNLDRLPPSLLDPRHLRVPRPHCVLAAPVALTRSGDCYSHPPTVCDLQTSGLNPTVARCCHCHLDETTPIVRGGRIASLIRNEALMLIASLIQNEALMLITVVCSREQQRQKWQQQSWSFQEALHRHYD